MKWFLKEAARDQASIVQVVTEEAPRSRSKEPNHRRQVRLL